MVKHTQAICRHKPTNYLSVFDHFVGLALKGLNQIVIFSKVPWQAIEALLGTEVMPM